MPMYLCRLSQMPGFTGCHSPEAFSLVFSSRAKPAVFWKPPGDCDCCLLAASRQSHIFPSPPCVVGGLLTPLQALLQVSQSEKPSGSTVLTWDGCSVQVKTRLFLVLCHHTGCFGEKASKPICLSATWDHHCPHRVQAVQVSTEANTTAPRSLSSEADLQHWTTRLSPPLTFSGGRRRLVW